MVPNILEYLEDVIEHASCLRREDERKTGRRLPQGLDLTQRGGGLSASWPGGCNAGVT